MVSTLSRFYPIFRKVLEEGKGLNGELASTIIGRSKTVGSRYWRVFLQEHKDTLRKVGALYYLSQAFEPQEATAALSHELSFEELRDLAVQFNHKASLPAPENVMFENERALFEAKDL